MWVVSAFGGSRPRLGRVRHVHDDGVIDVVLYAQDGRLIGRDSPAMGGPRDFEPCCNAAHWVGIERPDFAELAKLTIGYRSHLVLLA